MNRKGAYALGFVSGAVALAITAHFSIEGLTKFVYDSFKPKPAVVMEVPKPALRRTPGHDKDKFAHQRSRLEEVSSVPAAAPGEDSASPPLTGLEDKIGFKYSATFVGPGAVDIAGYRVTDGIYQISRNDSGSAQEILTFHNIDKPNGTMHERYKIWFDRDLTVTRIEKTGYNNPIVFDRKRGITSYPRELTPTDAKRELRKAERLLRTYKEITGVDSTVREWDGHSEIPKRTYEIDRQ